MKGTNRIIISVDTGKAFDKIEYLFMIKTVNKVNMEGTCLNMIKAVYDKPTTNSILNILHDEKLKAFLLSSGTRQGCPR